MVEVEGGPRILKDRQAQQSGYGGSSSTYRVYAILYVYFLCLAGEAEST
jgi:hypothetical protein